MNKILFLITSLSFLTASPPRKIPPSLLKAFTKNGRIPVYERYINSARSSKAPDDWSSEKIEINIGKIRCKQMNIFGHTDIWLSLALSKYKHTIEGGSIGIFSAIKPWYSSFALEYGGYPFSLEYILPRTIDPRIHIRTVADYMRAPQKFDAIISISNIQHDGLGRYNDPLNPEGDIIAMDIFKAMLRPGGYLFLSVPVCKDSLLFNTTRTYGRTGLPLLLKGWKIIESFGFNESDFSKSPKKGFKHQPVFVLTPE
jgi:hypothetical protein